MPLAPGTRLGPYEVLAPLGAGGMGEVYRARDTRLDRNVAVKVLPSDLTSDPVRRARFEREAKAVSSLNHPHVCTLYDVGQEQGTDYLVMELVEGATLAERLKQGALPVEQTLRTAIEIADALDKAHRQGLIHRDLKPGNVMLTKAGSKLMDFGLAKRALGGESGGNLSALPTEAPLTGQGTLPGTMAYMAPEQLEGKEADARSDLWAFGCVLHEMATGRGAFEGKSQASLMSAIMTADPQPIRQLQPLTPPTLERLVKVCLAKDPDDRLQTAHDVMQELMWIADGAGGGMVGAPTGPAAPARRTRLSWGLVGLTVGLLAGATAAALFLPSVDRRSGPASEVSRVLVGVGPAEELQDLSSRKGRLVQTAIALSPDGRSLVFAGVRSGQQQLYLRALDQLEATSIAGTEGGASPFFSPDGKWLGFWASDELRKVPLTGGPPVILCRTPLTHGASWGADDRIVFGRISGGLLQVSAAGGNPEELTWLDTTKGEVGHRLPRVLPGGDVVLFTVTHTRSPRWSEAQVAAYSRRTRARTVLIEGGADARYVASGHLVYVRDGVLMAAPFNRTHAAMAGGPVGLIPDIMQAAYDSVSASDSGAAQFDVSETGTLAYVPGGVVPEPVRHLVWVDRRGREDPIPLPPKAFLQPRISPDGKQIAVATLGRNMDVWVYGISRRVMTRLTTEGRYATPVWTPDGERLVYRGALAGPDNLFWRPADGSGTAERLTTSPHHLVPACWSPDGKTLLFYDVGQGVPGSATALWVLQLGSDRQPNALIQGSFGISGAEFSPDGQWIVYASDLSGKREVYVEPYGRSGARQQVSTSGGTSPVWRGDGQELLYIVPDVTSGNGLVKVMGVPVTTRPTFTAGTPVRLFEGTYWTTSPARNHDITPDGQRFLFVREKETSMPKLTQVILVQNWFEELKRRVPTR